MKLSFFGKNKSFFFKIKILFDEQNNTIYLTSSEILKIAFIFLFSLKVTLLNLVKL